MSTIDWIVMLGTLLFIVAYGVWKTRKNKNLESYLLGDKQMPWWTIGLSVMATQASAITFLSTPGQGYTDGMGFVQFYFGLPLAMVVIAVVFIPLYYRLKVYTAYEFLESRFGVNTRILTAGLFLLQRGLAAGITIYAPAIILSQILDWPLAFTIIFIGILVIAYTVSGGTKAVSQTHKQQMAVIFTGMFIAFALLINYLSEHYGFFESLQMAGKLGKMNMVDTEFDLNNRYTIWTGIIGGFFLQLSYFGTDQSQVQRYLGGSSVRESRLGLMFNAVLKIPMQVFILLCGVLVFLFYQHVKPPVHFNEQNLTTIEQEGGREALERLQANHDQLFEEKRLAVDGLAAAMREGNDAETNARQAEVMSLLAQEDKLREEVREELQKADPTAEPKDDDYIFITWVMTYLPVGLVGLLLAVIFSAAMSSTSAELNALASTSTVDMYKRVFEPNQSDAHYVKASRLLTAFFGVFAIGFALMASLIDNLIEAVNILGSLFYGTILGIFLVAFFVKWVKSTAVFIAAIVVEVGVITIYILTRYEVISFAYLWLNVLGALSVVLISIVLQALLSDGGNDQPTNTLDDLKE